MGSSSELTSRIIACATEVHNTLGPGSDEVVYQQALHRELIAAGLDAACEVGIEVSHRGIWHDNTQMDLVVDDCLIEVRACEKLEDTHVARAMSSLKASRNAMGLLINFGGPEIEVKRLENTR